VFERYTERARRVIFFARYEASQFGSSLIETQHLLLGLIREDKNLTNRFLRNSSSIESLRREIESRVERRERIPTSIDLPLSEECMRILAYANEETERLNHRHIGTEHLLLGILREEKCVAWELLYERGLRLDVIREELARVPKDRASGEIGFSGQHDAQVFGSLNAHGFTEQREHLVQAFSQAGRPDWAIATRELQLFIEGLSEAIQAKLNGDVSIFEGFDWGIPLRDLHSGLSDEEDWGFRLRLTMLLAEVLLKRFEQRLNR
jgi:hypothetical protein